MIFRKVYNWRYGICVDGREKQLFTSYITHFFDRLNYNCLYYMDGEEIIKGETRSVFFVLIKVNLW